MNKPKNVDSYISHYPPKVQKMLKQLRAVIKKNAPGAEEVISYGMPAYKYHGMLAYFAAHKNHIGLYPMPSAMGKFEKELRPYRVAKSTAQFPIGTSIPIGLVAKIIKWRVKENLQKEKAKIHR